MATPWRDIKKRASTKERAVAEKLKEERVIERAIHLAQVRTARQKTQEQLAESLHIKQAAISRLEQRTDLYISTLRRYVEALGGDLVISAVFPDTEIIIENLATLEEKVDEPAATSRRKSPRRVFTP